jgi:hypothetical protein
MACVTLSTAEKTFRGSCWDLTFKTREYSKMEGEISGPWNRVLLVTMSVSTQGPVNVRTGCNSLNRQAEAWSQEFEFHARGLCW